MLLSLGRLPRRLRPPSLVASVAREFGGTIVARPLHPLLQLHRTQLTFPRSFVEEERRLSLDKEPLTRTQYIAKYGEENGAEAWEEAAGRQYVELRFDSDGNAYTKEEVVKFWWNDSSDRDGIPFKMWDACRHLAHKLTIDIKSEEIIAGIVEQHSRYRQGMDDIHIATCWSRIGALAKRSRNEREWLKRKASALHGLREHAIAMMPLLEAQGLSNISNGLARAELSDERWFDLWEAIAEASVPQLRDFKPQALSNTAWAYATAQHTAPAVLDAIQLEVQRRGGLSSFSDRRAQTQLKFVFEKVPE